MKESVKEKKLFVKPQIKFCPISNNDIIATSDPDVIYPNLRD